MIYRIAEHGESKFHIAAHRYSDETIRFAASELQKYLLKATGTVVPYFSDRCPKRGPEIRIGADVRGETSVENDLREDGFRIRADGENITITGRNSRGVLYGVYAFLEKFCGFQCFTKDVELIDRFDILDIDLDEIVEEPEFFCRDDYFTFAFDGGFASKNRLNSNMADLSKAKGGRMKWYNFHHSFADLVPEQIWFDTHPEYFSEWKGERIRGGQLCLSEPGVFDAARDMLRRWIRENPDCRVFSVAQNDNTTRCTCKKCLAIEAEEGSPSGPVIRFVNRLADDIREDYPDVLLHTFAYQYTLPAPKKAVARDNVIVRICSISCRFDRPMEQLAAEDPAGEEAVFTGAVRDWQHHASQLYIWDYTVNFWHYLQPFFHFSTLAENIRFFARMGVRGVLEQGNFAYGGGAAGDELKAYLIAKLLWDPKADIYSGLRRFCMAVYGEASGPFMEEYYLAMEKACSSDRLTIFENSDAPWVNDEIIVRAEELFEQALAVAETSEFRRRIEREQLAVRYLRLSRQDPETPGRAEKVRQFFRDVKAHGLTEVSERTSLRVSENGMLAEKSSRERPDGYSLYYIMQ